MISLLSIIVVYINKFTFTNNDDTHERKKKETKMNANSISIGDTKYVCVLCMDDIHLHKMMKNKFLKQNPHPKHIQIALNEIVEQIQIS